MARLSAAVLAVAVLLVVAVLSANAENGQGKLTIPKNWLRSGLRVKPAGRPNGNNAIGKLYLQRLDYNQSIPGCNTTVTANCFYTTWLVKRGAQSGTLIVPVKDIQNTNNSGRKLLQGASCPILNLVLGPLNLNLLGLQVDLNQVVLDITAVPGAGNLLGNLLCSVAGLLDGPLGGLLGAGGLLSNLLNNITGLLGGLLGGIGK